MHKLITFAMSTVFILFSAVQAQVASYNVSSGSSKMKIYGGSNAHDWDETVKKVSGSGKMQIGTDVLTIEQLSFKADVKSIESTKGSIMDEKTWDALKSDKHPYITFELDKVLKSSPVSGGMWLNTQGYLTIAGVKKLVKLDVKALYTGPTSIAFEGSKTFNMSEFGIDPPTALMGSMKVKDEVKIQFKVFYNKI
jgi:polyisoprenoid-binding protein YceI